MTVCRVYDILRVMPKRQDMRRLIQTAFRASGKSVKAVSREGGIPYATAHGLLLHDRDVTLSTIEKVCVVFDLELVRRKEA